MENNFYHKFQEETANNLTAIEYSAYSHNAVQTASD